MAPFSLYIHIPFCKSKCAYCDFFSVAGSKLIKDSYIEKLLEEAEKRAVQFGVSEWKTIYIGGGTPSLLKADQIENLLSNLLKIRPVSHNGEITFECNPDDITEELLMTLKKSGVNRLSIGLQSMNEASLKLVNRRAGRAENLNAIELINRFWVEKEKIFDLEPNGEKSTKSRRFSVDLICGLPLETKASFFEGLKIVLDCGADHVSLYSLTLEENTALFDAVENGTVELPDTEETDGWWIDACELLEKSGFKQYEVSNFAKEGCFSRHNMTYWRMEPYIGIGAGATGTVKNLRYTNTSVIEHWIKNFADEKENLSTETQKFEYLMMGFRTFEGVDEDEFERRFGEKIENSMEPVCSKWLNRGLAVKNGKKIALNKKGLLLLNAFLEEILENFNIS